MSSGLANVTVVAERAEVARPRRRTTASGHDLVAARACAPLPVLAELALPLLAVGGTLLAWKGPLAAGDDELDARDQGAAPSWAAASAELGRPAPPRSAATRSWSVRKERPTPERYPRRPGRRPAAGPLG